MPECMCVGCGGKNSRYIPLCKALRVANRPATTETQVQQKKKTQHGFPRVLKFLRSANDLPMHFGAFHQCHSERLTHIYEGGLETAVAQNRHQTNDN